MSEMYQNIVSVGWNFSHISRRAFESLCAVVILSQELKGVSSGELQ